MAGWLALPPLLEESIRDEYPTANAKAYTSWLVYNILDLIVTQKRN